jgi:hypothetical protein
MNLAAIEKKKLFYKNYMKSKKNYIAQTWWEGGGVVEGENPQGSWSPNPWNLAFVTIHRILIICEIYTLNFYFSILNS